MNRAYSVLTVKSFDDEQRIIKGIATTPTPDRDGDIVEPMGVTFDGHIPLLWQHRAAEPVGTVEFETPTAEGVNFTARLPVIDEPGTLKDRVDEAWQSVKHNLVKAVSIGFRPLETSRLESGGFHFLKSQIFELSLVTIPSQSEAIISVVKQLDLEQLDKAGIDQAEQPQQEAKPDEAAALGNGAVVVKLFDDDDARDRAKPFEIKRIICAGE